MDTYIANRNRPLKLVRCGVLLAARLERILNVQTSTQLRAYANLDRAVRLPLAVSGAFSTDHAIMTSTNWETMIVGRSIDDAVHLLDTPRQLTTLIHQRGARLSSARDTPS